MLARRSFLLGASAAVAAPAIIRTAGLLMPVRAIIEPTWTHTQVSFSTIVTETLRHRGDDYSRLILRTNALMREALEIPAFYWQARDL